MEDYDITTLPDGYEPLAPSSTGGFQIFVVLVSVAILCLGGYGLYNWLETGKFMRKNVVTESIQSERPGSQLQRVTPTTVETFKVMTRDGVTIEVQVTMQGKLSEESKDGLRVFVLTTEYKEMRLGHVRNLLQSWANSHDIIEMNLKSSKPIPSKEID